MSSVGDYQTVEQRRLPAFTIPVGALPGIVALCDMTVIIVAQIAASLTFGAREHLYLDGFRDSFIGLAIILSIGRSLGLYRLQNILNPELRRILYASVISVLVVVFVIFLGKVSADYSRSKMLGFGLLSFLLLLFSRFGLAGLFSAGIDRKVIRGRRVVLIGDVSELRQLRKSEVMHFGIEEIARFGLANGNSDGLAEADIGRVKGAIDVARDLRADEFAILLPWSREHILSEITLLLRASPLTVRLYPDGKTRDILNQNCDGDLDNHFSVILQREPLSLSERLLKRAVDVCLSLMGLVFLSPLLLIVAVLIKLDSPGPIFFRQRRCGFDNREFLIWKFRSMKVLEDGSQVTQARKNDDRVTTLGRLLRRSSVDELPQLFNVLRGEMSLVGPRPHAMAHDELYGNLIAEYSMRHHVKPGLTGLAQVKGCRGETRTVEEMEKRVKHDIWYVNNWSIWLDLRVIAQTFVALMRHEAY